MKKGKWILGTVLTLFAALLLLAGAFAVESFAMLDLDKIRNQPLSTVLYDRDGKEAALLSGAQKRSWMPIEDLSQDLKNAFLAAEDARFYRHPGVDFVRIGGALISNIKSGGYAQGASTITQQLVKLTHLTSEKTILRKAREALMALKLETELSKDEIFEAYLNTVYFGAGAYGAQAAAQTYFGVDAGQLTLAQAALLAGVVKSPTNYAPRQHPDEAVKRRNRVLAAMAEQGFIPPEIETAAQAEALALKPVEGQDQALSWFTEAAAAEAASVLQIDYEDLLSGGYKLYTTLDRAAQKSAEALCGDAAYFPPDASDGTPVQTALVCLDGAGELRAVMGGRRVETQRGLNRAIDIRRQPGSAFKPISVYAAAVDRFGYLPVRLIDDTRRTFAGGYNPGNFGDTYAGRVTLREALSRSLNVATVDLAEKTGIPAARQYAQAAGIELSSADNNLSLALGSLTEGVSPLALCAAYGPLYTGGNWTQPHAVRRITDAAGETVYRFTGEKRRVFSETSAALLTDMLRTAATTGTARKLGALPFQAAGKTGTVGQPDGGNRDVWTVAYTPKLCVAVWMGFDQPDSRHVLSDAVTGSSHPCALATAFLREVAAPESVPTVVEFGEGGKRREWSKVLDHADSSVDQTPVSVNRPRADCRTGICRKPLIRRNPRSASRKPAAA